LNITLARLEKPGVRLFDFDELDFLLRGSCGDETSSSQPPPAVAVSTMVFPVISVAAAAAEGRFKLCNTLPEGAN